MMGSEAMRTMSGVEEVIVAYIRGVISCCFRILNVLAAQSIVCCGHGRTVFM